MGWGVCSGIDHLSHSCQLSLANPPGKAWGVNGKITRFHSHWKTRATSSFYISLAVPCCTSHDHCSTENVLYLCHLILLILKKSHNKGHVKTQGFTVSAVQHVQSIAVQKPLCRCPFGICFCLCRLFLSFRLHLCRLSNHLLLLETYRSLLPVTGMLRCK